jgi:predicted dienelactone hydrolase
MVVLASLLSAAQAEAGEAGWRTYTVPPSAVRPPIPVHLYYPTQAPAADMAMGPFTIHAAAMAPPDAQFKGLIVISHGTGGSEFNHGSLASHLARNGYLVAALRHPGDNWQDNSVWTRPPGAFFSERPPHVSAVLDALLADPAWKDRIAADAKGPRIGVLGHSAGGYTAVALAGGQPDLTLIGAHCREERAADPLFCARVSDETSQVPRPIAPMTDPRVRAVVALAPLGAVFTEASLAGVRIPVDVYAAEADRWLVPRFHAARIARLVPGAEWHNVANAWHFAFMDPPRAPIPTADGDAAADPPGFDRVAFLAQLRGEVSVFFDKALGAQ